MKAGLDPLSGSANRFLAPLKMMAWDHYKMVPVLLKMFFSKQEDHHFQEVKEVRHKNNFLSTDIVCNEILVEGYRDRGSCSCVVVVMDLCRAPGSSMVIFCTFSQFTLVTRFQGYIWRSIKAFFEPMNRYLVHLKT